MKVAQVLYSGLGGHGSVAFSLMGAARAAQASVPSLIFFGIEPVLREYERKCVDEFVPYQHIRTLAGAAWLKWPSLYRALARVRPDAIILHSVKAILPCALYARRHRIPLLAVEHQPNALKSRAEWWVSRALMKLADAIVLLTPMYQEELKAELGSRWVGNKVHLIPNGIDTDTFRQAAPAIRTETPRLIGMAARMTGTKRQDLLVSAMAVLCERDGRPAWRLTLAGDGTGLEKLREQVRSLQLDDVVTIAGYLDEAALQRWFGTLDIYAHASDGETLSTSILQAMAMGLPIVGSDVPGIANLLAEGDGVGLAVEQTPGAFADALQTLFADTDLADGLRERARSLAVERYSQSSMFRRYQDLLERLCTR